MVDTLQARLRQLRSLGKPYATQWRAVVLTLGLKWRMDDCTCQACIARHIGTTRPHVSLVLKRVGGLWIWSSARWGGHHPSARNGPTRGQQYALTTAGWGAYADILSACNGAPSDTLDPWLKGQRPAGQYRPPVLSSPSPSVVRLRPVKDAHEA